MAAANDRSVFGKMVRRSVTKKSNSTYNCRSSAPSHSRMRDNAKSTNAEELKIKHSQKYSFDVPKLSQDSALMATSRVMNRTRILGINYAKFS